MCESPMRHMNLFIFIFITFLFYIYYLFIQVKIYMYKTQDFQWARWEELWESWCWPFRLDVYNWCSCLPLCSPSLALLCDVWVQMLRLSCGVQQWHQQLHGGLWAIWPLPPTGVQHPWSGPVDSGLGMCHLNAGWLQGGVPSRDTSSPSSQSSELWVRIEIEETFPQLHVT